MPFQEMMRAWVNGDCAGFKAGSPEMEEFREWWERITIDRQSDKDEEYTVEYLKELRRSGNDSIESVAGFRIALQRYIRKKHPTGASELWNITNDALKELANEGRIRLVFREDLSANRAHNSDLWAISDSDSSKNDGLDCQPDSFKDVVEDLWYSTVHLERKKNKVRKNARLVSPQEAKRFFLAVLERYNCPMTMELLNGAITACNLLSLLKVSDEGGQNDDVDAITAAIERKPASGLSERSSAFIFFEAGLRGGKLGEKLCKDKLCSLYVEYYLSKELSGAKVVLTGVDGGTAQRNSERVKSIVGYIKEHLPFNERPDDFVPDEVALGDVSQTKEEFADTMATVRLELFTLTLELAGKFCKEKCSN